MAAQQCEVCGGAWGITSVAFPPLGCGNGGLEWATVGPLMYAKLKGLGIPVELYAPFGTPTIQLKEEFLAADQQMEFSVKGRRREKLRPEWAVLVEVLYELEQQPYANPVGRTIFQKICYILTKQGVDTGFQFERKSYGPFAEEVKEAINVLANNNWVIEQQLGQMTALRVGPEYAKARVMLAEELKPFQRKIDKTVDLFSRIKNTDQAGVGALQPLHRGGKVELRCFKKKMAMIAHENVGMNALSGPLACLPQRSSSSKENGFQPVSTVYHMIDRAFKFYSRTSWHPQTSSNMSPL